MNNQARVFLFKHYWWIVGLILIVGILLILALSPADNVATQIGTLCAAALGVVYFMQKQKIEELQLFERLFTRFNERYDEMHGDLQRVAAGREPDESNANRVLDAYFNLCAEEFLFFKEGRILPCVWQAWCRGMWAYLRSGNIEEYWKEEVRSGSHYGLTLEEIEKGAK